ncbi:FKBP-type peptidyl-prolyl cis-trans isomerase [Dactylosporangium siamense]|uniref:FKBP-type peptidyl-prolyl cis-trans isomerase n=1 Tax=Dactylosporangium siamense TaxID=685454 RepID=UPI00194293AB|nr:FKBP-type peptidyl-prolyl cis-trans isomerase [Dactylosporangium siamense]
MSLGKKDDDAATSEVEAAEAAEDADAETAEDADAEAETADDPEAAADADDAGDDSGDAAGDEEDAVQEAETSKAAKGKNAKVVAPLSKAEKRAAARIAAAKAARRRRTGQAIAGTLILVLAVGGAFAGIWYFGDRAEKNKVKCKPVGDPNAFPPLLGGMDKALATEPKIDADPNDIKALRTKVLIKGDCKTVKAGQTVVVNYVGATMTDGKVFAASWTDKKTFETPVGQKQLGKEQKLLLPLDEGMVGLKVGTRVQFDIPNAYGEDPPQGAPRGTLRFIFDILDAKDADAGGLPAGFGG